MRLPKENFVWKDFQQKILMESLIQGAAIQSGSSILDIVVEPGNFSQLLFL